MEKKETKVYNIDTMAGVGEKINIAGREYEILPVNIEDMGYVINENQEARLLIPNKELIDSKELDWSVFGHNLLGERKKIFIKVVNKYVYYHEKPMTEKLLIEHNWSFKEIGKFLYSWVQISE